MKILNIKSKGFICKKYSFVKTTRAGRGRQVGEGQSDPAAVLECK